MNDRLSSTTQPSFRETIPTPHTAISAVPSVAPYLPTTSVSRANDLNLDDSMKKLKKMSDELDSFNERLQASIQDLSNTVNAFATMKYHHSELFDNVATTAIPIIDTFNPLGSTNTAFAKTNHTHQKFFNASPSLQHSDLWIQRLLSCQLPSYQHRKTQQQTYYLPELPHTLYHPFTYCLLQLLLLLHHMKQGFTKFYCTPRYITWLRTRKAKQELTK